MANVDLDALGGMTLTMFGAQYELGDLNVGRQDAAQQLDEIVAQVQEEAKRKDGESDEDFYQRQRELTIRQMSAMSDFIVKMIDDPGDLAAKLAEAIESGKWGLLRLRRAQDAIMRHLETASEVEGND